MEGESSEGEIPFAKRSRTVHRYQSEPVLSDSTHEERYGQQFWERLSRRQSSCSMGTEGPGLMSSYPVARQDVAWGSLPAPGQEKLPSPAELCGGKKKRQRMNERRDMVMYYHLQDLRKKQSSIDQLKSLKWGGCETSESEIRAEITGAADASAQIPEVFRSPVRMAASERGVKPGDFLSSSPQQRRAGPMFSCLSPLETSPACFLYSPQGTRDGTSPQGTRHGTRDGTSPQGTRHGTRDGTSPQGTRHGTSPQGTRHGTRDRTSWPFQYLNEE
ncbi:uncharacterized protein LOC142475360 [Ascaphus truei]|uniref:uncharacterized protein LOC142475360 n=1 Tax=Ascaphus truei TaxID=8439 RepID=UPI003F5A5A1C